VFDIYTIIFLALAVFIFLRLRSVLGQRTGRERPPYDPYSSAPGTIRPAAPGDKVVALPGRAPDAAQKTAEPAEPVDRWKGITEPGSALATGLDAIAREDKSFDARNFLTGARAAYDMIVTAYAAGDRKQLKSLLGKEVYDGFESAIKEREQKGETVETRFVAIDGADLSAAEQRGKTSVTRAKDGAVIDGNPDKVTDVTDVWTFARDVSSRDPNWKLVATEAGQ
jgi:predicted lipid-binding transport protein (Tim44 family)